MAHPFAEHRAHKVSKHRVGHIMKSGGHPHSDAAADKKLFSQLIAQHEAREHDAPGHKRGGRLDKYARGGKVKDKGHQVNIAIVTGHGRHQPPGGPALPGGPPPVAPPPGAMGAGPPPPPGGLPGGPPGLMPRPPMKRGGRVKFAHGGKVGMKAGAESGEGRLQKVRAYGHKAGGRKKAG